MFPYRVKYTESEYDIQNNDLLYKMPPKRQKYFRKFGKIQKIWKNTKFFFIICINSIIDILYILYFCNFCTLGIYGFLYYTCRPLLCYLLIGRRPGNLLAATLDAFKMWTFQSFAHHSPFSNQHSPWTLSKSWVRQHASRSNHRCPLTVGSKPSAILLRSMPKSAASRASCSHGASPYPPRSVNDALHV